jgi:localization factor PodJL
MRLGVPWNVKGLRPEARETARQAARRSGMSLGEWLNGVILEQAAEVGVRAPGHDDEDDETYAGELASVHERLDDLTRRIGQFTRTAEKVTRRPREEPRSEAKPDRIAELIERLDRRMEQFVAQAARPAPAPTPQTVLPLTQQAPAAPLYPPHAYYPPQWQHAQPPVMPAPPLQPSIIPVRPRPPQSAAPAGPEAYAPPPKVFTLPPAAYAPPPPQAVPHSIQRAVAEITARQRALKGDPPQAAPAPDPVAAAEAQAQPAPQSMLPVVRAQDLSGLEDQLRKITDQIETLRRPGVEEAINALRDELGDIGRALNDAVPRRALDTIERQIQTLTQRIAEGRHAGADQNALAGLEHGLAEVRDALRHLTPAEMLVGFNEAVAGLAHKIDLIVAQKDPETLHQLEHAITTLREMAAHVASNDAIKNLSAQVHTLGQKVEELSRVNAGDALSGLERRIEALSKAIAERAQNGGSVPPRLENLVQSLSEKIERIQESRTDDPAVSHLEDRIVKLVDRIDASDSRLGHLEAIERGLADLLVQVEDMRAMKQADSLRAEAQSAVGVDALKHDLARTQTTLEAVNGTLGHLVDRLSQMEKEFREDRRPASDEMPLEMPQASAKIALRAAPEPTPEPPEAPPAPRAVEPKPAPAPAPVQAAAPKRVAKITPINPDLPPDQPLEPGSGPPRARTGARIAADAAAPAPAKSSFIAAARRAAKAVQDARQPKQVEAEPPEAEGSGRMMKRVKSLFVAASVAAIVIGGVQVGSEFLWNPSSSAPKKTAQAPARPSAAPEPLQTRSDVLNASPLAPAPMLPPPLDIQAPEPQPSAKEPMSVAPPPASEPDVTGSIPAPARTANPVDRLPAEIGGTRLRTAAATGDAAAEYEIATRYAEGRGVVADLGEAARWYERSAGKGVALAQFRYATMLEKGVGVKKDLGQARRYYLAAAGRGNAKAMHNLAVLYAEGIDGKPDFGNAVQWFRKAAEHGVADSQYNLAVLLARGLGAPKDIAESYKWFALAAAQGDKEAARKRDEVAGKLDEKSLAAAQQDVKTFTPKSQPAEAAAVSVPAGGWDDPVQGRGPTPGKNGQSRTAGAFKLGKR